MAKSDEKLGEGNPEGHSTLLEGEASLPNAGIKQDTPAPPAFQGVNKNDTSSLPKTGEQQQHVGKTRKLGKSVVSSVVLSALAALLVCAFLGKRRSLTAEGENPPLTYSLSTDNEGLKKTLEVAEEHAKLLRKKWDASSPDVREAFLKFYSPKLFAEDFTEEQNMYWCDKYVDALNTQPLPADTASEVERQEFAIRTSLITAIFRATMIRLNHLIQLEELSQRYQIPSVFSAKTESSIPLLTQEDKQDTVSFEQFTRRLQKLGVAGIAQEGNSEPKVPSVLADDLGNATAIKLNYQSSSIAVVEEFERLLASVDNLMAGMNEEDKERLQKINVPDSDIPLPYPILIRAAYEGRAIERVCHLDVSQIREWKNEWDDVHVTSNAEDVRDAHKSMFDIALDAKHVLLEQWGHLEDIDSVSTNLAPVAILLF